MIDLDDVEDGIKALERAARLNLSGAMITKYPLEHRRYDGGNTARVYHFDVARLTVPA